MGTLFDQPPRKWVSIREGTISEFEIDATKLCERLGCSISEAIAALHVLELRRANDIAVMDGDIKDEQLAGFGELLKEITEELGLIREALHPDE